MKYKVKKIKISNKFRKAKINRKVLLEEIKRIEKLFKKGA